ncbi:MAG: hypothetical protein IPM36_20905 [Lewinellaceae bacterium]|nr:hypothetical protein [Lewinellaceae bacterium]
MILSVNTAASSRSGAQTGQRQSAYSGLIKCRARGAEDWEVGSDARRGPAAHAKPDEDED